LHLLQLLLLPLALVVLQFWGLSLGLAVRWAHLAHVATTSTGGLQSRSIVMVCGDSICPRRRIVAAPTLLCPTLPCWQLRLLLLAVRHRLVIRFPRVVQSLLPLLLLRVVVVLMTQALLL
jgi:hypothetical protein